MTGSLRIYREPYSIRGWWKHRSLFEVSTKGLGLAFGLNQFGDDYDGRYSLHLRLLWPNIFVTLPIRTRSPIPVGEMSRTWGFSFFERSIHLNWDTRCKIVHLPWAWEWVRTSYLMADEKTWLHELRSDRPALNPKSPFKNNFEHYSAVRDAREAGEWRADWPYKYPLSHGEIQERVATISIYEMEHRWRWLIWTRAFARLTKSIDVRFSDEVGERSGSWKGGCIGCSYSMRENETAFETLCRMERERKFS